jgi:hypothetical protein
MTTPANWQPAPPSPKRSIVKPIAITLVSGFLLGLGSCFGFLSTLSFNGPSKPVNTLFMIGFGVGLVLFLSACVRAVVAVFAHIFSGHKEK